MTPLAIEPTATPKLVLSVAHHAVEDVQELCARCGLAVETIAGAGWRRALLIVEGGAVALGALTEVVGAGAGAPALS